MKKIILSAFLCLFIFSVNSQIAANRITLKYLINKKKINTLREKGYLIKSKSQPNKKSFDIGNFKNGYFKCIINFKDGVLNIDPFTIVSDNIDNKLKSDHIDNELKKVFVNPDTTLCQVNAKGDTICLIGRNTTNDLFIDLNRKKIGDPTYHFNLPYQTVIVGVNNIAAKFRPKVSDYNDSVWGPNVVSGNINLGLTIGYSFGWTRFTHRSNNSFSITPLASLGFSGISLSKEPLKNKISFTYQPSNFVLSPSFGVVFARNDLGVLFSYGFDIMFGKNSENWAYQKKGWFGIGIAAGLKL